jgi:hypothetical protein
MAPPECRLFAGDGGKRDRSPSCDARMGGEFDHA